MARNRETAATNAPAGPAVEADRTRPKGAGDENFPVASVLIAPALRPHIHAFYAFARAADDVADDPRLGPDQKLKRLDALEEALTGFLLDGSGASANPAKDGGPSVALAASLAETGVCPSHARYLLAAFRQDAVKKRYGNWGELMDYCRLSAAPCGRYLLALHGETGAAVAAAADALSEALQVINHIQDCADDYRNLDRAYLPLDWLEAEGASVGDLAAGATSPALRRVFDRMLGGIDRLLADARPLPALIKSPRLALEAAIVLAVARKLSQRLKAEDPLAGPIRLSRPQFAYCAAIGLVQGAWARVRRQA